MQELLMRAIMRWVGILYRLHVNLYAVSAINRKSFTALCCIGGHWQVKTETLYYTTRILLFQKINIRSTLFVPRSPLIVPRPCLLIGIQRVMPCKDSRTTYSATLVLYGCLGRKHLHFAADTTTLYTLHSTLYTLHRHPSTINRSSAAFFSINQIIVWSLKTNHLSLPLKIRHRENIHREKV